MFQGFANSLGQRNWFESSTFNLDWCFYLRADKAAKNLYAGFDWDDDAFAAKVDWSARQLAALDREPISLSPGDYRTYLAPRAMEELVQLLSWYGGVRAASPRDPPDPAAARCSSTAPRCHRCVRSARTPPTASPPNFQSAGSCRPTRVPLIVDGAYADTLVSPRSAQEYGVADQRRHRRRVPAVDGGRARRAPDRRASTRPSAPGCSSATSGTRTSPTRPRAAPRA